MNDPGNTAFYSLYQNSNPILSNIINKNKMIFKIKSKLNLFVYFICFNVLANQLTVMKFYINVVRGTEMDIGYLSSS